MRETDKPNQIGILTHKDPWQAEVEVIRPEQIHKLRLYKGTHQLSYGEVLTALGEESAFRHCFSMSIAMAPFSALRWETPPLTRDTLNQPFECALLNKPELVRTVYSEAFRPRFRESEAVVAFPNLRGDATLVVPCPRGPEAVYGHLAGFLRQGPESQIHSLWAKVAEEMLSRVSPRPVWLNTAGMGISWLHVRLDDAPKYYGYGPYRSFP